MSWFSVRDPEASCSGLDPVGEEVGEGVCLARRGVLRLGAASVGALLGLGERPARAGGHPVPLHSEEEFANLLREIHPLACAQRATGARHEESYLLQVAAAMARLAAPGSGVREAMKAFRAEHAESGERFPISAVVFEFQPGKGFSHHDHRDYNGVLLGLTGEIRVRNFDVLGDDPVPPAGQSFEIRETRDDLLLPGRFSSLGRRRENVHEVIAGEAGASVLDFFTYYADDARSYWMEVAEAPRDPARRIYEAAWR